jgi:hypothetical protein
VQREYFLNFIRIKAQFFFLQILFILIYHIFFAGVVVPFIHFHLYFPSVSIKSWVCRERKPSGGCACVDFNQVKVKCHVHACPKRVGWERLWMAELQESKQALYYCSDTFERWLYGGRQCGSSSGLGNRVLRNCHIWFKGVNSLYIYIFARKNFIYLLVCSLFNVAFFSN